MEIDENRINQSVKYDEIIFWNLLKNLYANIVKYYYSVLFTFHSLLKYFYLMWYFMKVVSTRVFPSKKNISKVIWERCLDKCVLTLCIISDLEISCKIWLCKCWVEVYWNVIKIVKVLIKLILISGNIYFQKNTNIKKCTIFKNGIVWATGCYFMCREDFYG